MLASSTRVASKNPAGFCLWMDVEYVSNGGIADEIREALAQAEKISFASV